MGIREIFLTIEKELINVEKNDGMRENYHLAIILITY